MMCNTQPLVYKCQPNLHEVQRKLLGTLCLFNQKGNGDLVTTGISSPSLGNRRYVIMYYSGKQDSLHKNSHSDRVIMLQLITNIRKINIIQVYRPTWDKEEQEVESFHE